MKCSIYLSNFLEAEVDQFYEDLQDLSRTDTQKRCPFHHRGLECKSKKSRDTWSIVVKFDLGGQNEAKANRVLSREHTGHGKHPLPTTQEMTLHMDITRWSIMKSD